MSNGMRSGVLMRGAGIGTLYKLLGRTDTGSYYHTFILDIDEISSHLSTRPCYGIDGWDTSTKKDFVLCIVNIWLKDFLIVHLNLISVNIMSMERKIT